MANKSNGLRHYLLNLSYTINQTPERAREEKGRFNALNMKHLTESYLSLFRGGVQLFQYAVACMSMLNIDATASVKRSRSVQVSSQKSYYLSYPPSVGGRVVDGNNS